MYLNPKQICFLLTWLLLPVLVPGVLQGQTYLYFQDSPDSEYYDFSWMELTPPSELERKNEPDLRKFPVESGIAAQQGANSLRLKWRSVSGGDWLAIAAGDSWMAKDISDTDTLVFWIQSIEGINSTDLPEVFMEDVSNKKSVLLPLADWSADLLPGIWTRMTIPMSLFFSSGDGVDYTRIKTIGFRQGISDGADHTLLIDNMRVNKGDGSSPPVASPKGVRVDGYEYHMEISWDPNPETHLSGYEIERSLDGGSTYTPLLQVNANTNMHLDWIKSLGENLEASYRIKALNEANEPSLPSEAVSASTHSMTDEELLDMVQKYTFRYFWDFAHEASGMSRERNSSGNTVTSGGSGFGIMSIPVGIERAFITREEGVNRTLKILNFLSTADRFHGAWPHWINGNTGKVIPFSSKDNGGDIVETSFMAQGLLTIRQYFTGDNPEEKQIVQMATDLWEGIEWDWYRRNGSSSIYWHWSPEYNWDMNMTVTGWNEAAIVYLMAIASPTYGVPASLWNSGWARNSNYTNNKSFYGHRLYVGRDYGGPLFFAHYSFLGFDPRDKSDGYANYFDQNRNHSLVQQAYCEDNPKGFTGYSKQCWGLTASDDPDGYLAHEPNSSRDNGTIAPTAALSSFPYAPEESMLALKHFYRELGDKTWGEMGFYDAFNEQRNWYANSYLAIDQGPIILMIENYRSQLLWDLFMSNPEIQPMLDAIGFFHSPNSLIKRSKMEAGLTVYPNPASGNFLLTLTLKESAEVKLEISSLAGTKIQTIQQQSLLQPGKYNFQTEGTGLEPGFYLVSLILNGNETKTLKIVIH
jgi:hypothetical protein